MIIGSCVTEVYNSGRKGITVSPEEKIEATFANSCFSRFPSSSNGKNSSRTFWCIATIYDMRKS